MADPATTDVVEDLAEEALSPTFVRSVVDAVDRADKAQARELVLPLRTADLAELLELLRPDERQDLVGMLGTDFNPEVLSELDESVRDHVIELLDPKDLAAALTEMDSDDAVYLLEDMDEAEQRRILEQLPASERAALEQSLDYPEYSAGRLMQRELVAVPPQWDVGQTLDYLREAEELPHEFYEIFVVDPAYRPIGTVPLSRVTRSKRPVLISEIMETEQTLIPVEMDQEEVALQFSKYDLISAAVVDEGGRLVGVVTVDDIVEVISEEAAEDIRLLAGLGEESISDSVLQTSRSRVPWLLVNLVTAVLAASVIALFDATIEKMVALAVLMPIVASMGGNAGTQTMTVTVRALATRDLVHFNVRRTISREFLVGILNGMIFAAILGALSALLFGNEWLGAVFAGAIMINLVVASLTGILIPLGLDKLGADPAVSSAVFVTTMTDVVGFFSFLGLAALILFY
ncbi:magnesium transporter [Parvibaculum sp.]|uniref:magnesium transporter n=1 Tax=Parvibaculum sp. TaxID=2024848 RepID=UPI00272F37DE|nr:magnesium transporter [Parvibaculum sp.]MDP1628390.1 magnesium transporter [Parvibaculum sp.]MDP2149891.1 magnesium transporter [Parvibaculum sp.]MDP3329503.1 magnesium transporter [Parvibaculum sp.]